MPSFDLISNLAGASLFFALLILLIINWRGQLIGGLLIVGSITSILFFSGVAYNSASGAIPLAYIRSLELLRNLSWLVFLGTIIKYQSDFRNSFIRKYLLPAIVAAISLLVLGSIYNTSDTDIIPGIKFFGPGFLYYGNLFLALIGLVLIEQIYRNTKPNYRWTIKFLCVGLGGVFVYDFFIYSDAVLFKRINPDFWYARGMINAVCVPLLAVSIKRVREWNMELFISRHIVFQSSMILLAGVYLSFMALSGYYVRAFGGSWGGALQTVFVFTALLGLLIIFFSTDIRARLKIFLAKHFYENKYDYRDEWLGFTRTLADTQGVANFHTDIIRAFDNIMNCNGGAVWLISKNKYYECAGEIHLKEALPVNISIDTRFIQFLSDSQWVINIEDFRANPQRYRNLELPPFINELNSATLVIPLFLENDILGFILLTQSDINAAYNWEDYDLLKTMGRQTASFIAHLRATEDLAQAKQFEAFNRLSAFVVHDMKNIAAQLSLICRNAIKYKDNKEFLDDAFMTINNAVMKMNRLTRTLKKDAIKNILVRESVELETLIEEIIKLRNVDKPTVTASINERHLSVYANRDRLGAVIEHIVQNAQEATPDEGKVEICLNINGNQVEICVIDTGCGMDDIFIKTRLFKPFDTTKGNAGMGIGVYESRAIIEEHGGHVTVSSIPGEGTTFKIFLPLAAEDITTNTECKEIQ